MSVDGCTVCLSGEVGSYYLRQLAVAATKRVAGVIHVIDDIVVCDRENKLARPLARH